MQRMTHDLQQDRPAGGHHGRHLVRDAVRLAIGSAAEAAARRIGRRSVLPTVEIDESGVEVDAVSRVVDDEDRTIGEVGIEHVRGRHRSALEHAIEPGEHERLTCRFGLLQLLEVRGHIAPRGIAHVRRDPVGRCLRRHARHERVVVRVDETGEQHLRAEVGHRGVRSRGLAVGQRADGDDPTGAGVDGDGLRARIGGVDGDDGSGLDDDGVGHSHSSFGSRVPGVVYESYNSGYRASGEHVPSGACPEPEPEQWTSP